MVVLTNGNHQQRNERENDTQSSVLIPRTIEELLLQFLLTISNSKMVKKLNHDRLKQKFIKITTKKGGSTLKIFGDELNPVIPYTTFLLSIKDTAEWIVKEMLEKSGLKYENSQNYCLVQIVIPPRDQIIKEMILHDKDCPLNIYLNHSPKTDGSIVFKVIKCPPEYIEIRQRLHIQDRIINDHLPMFIEINNDGTDLLSPRVYKLHPNTTYVGRDIKVETGRQYFYIDGFGINRNHCTIENENGIVTLIPNGEIWLNRKLVSTSFILQHAALICFGRSSIFRYYDQKTKAILTQIKQQNENKLSIYASLPILPANDGQSRVLQKKISANNVVEARIKFNVLPGLLEVSSETETRFLHAVFDNYPLNNIHFRLTPVYILYMTLRHRLSPYGKSNLSFIQKQEDVISLLHRIDDMIKKKIEECQEHIAYLAYWLGNISEFIYFLKQDRDLSKISYDIQMHLVERIQRSLYYLINHLQNELDKHLIAFTNPRDLPTISDNLKSSENRWIIFDKTSNEYSQLNIDDMLAMLSSLIDLLRKCRVNAGLTIEIFSQLFHYINTWLFNRIVCCLELKLCSSSWGEKIFIRLKSIHDWALKQGLELPSECYLLKINQLCLLLQSKKRHMHDVQQLTANNTFQINSIQITQILDNYILSKNESPISNSFRQALLSFAYEHVDGNLQRDGFGIQLAEESDLNLPFLLPEDGYTCENLRGIPQQVLDFIEPMNRSALCRLFTNSYSLGLWTEFMQIPNNESRKDRIETITLNKKNNSLGLSIVSATNESQQFQGIYIKGIIPGGAAEDDGYLQPGDQILSVDQIRLINVTQEQATEALKQCGSLVTLQILKNAATHHGLSALFPSSSTIHHQLAIQPLRSTQSSSYQSNSNLLHANQHFHNINRNIPSTQPLVFREDLPSNETRSLNSTKSVLPPKTLPKPMSNKTSINGDRVSSSHYQTNGNNNEEFSPRSSDEFDAKLKRRLEQFEREREIERAHIRQMSAKRQADLEARLRQDREREIRAERDMQDFKAHRISQEASKEQARLLKHICIPNEKLQRNKKSK